MKSFTVCHFVLTFQYVALKTSTLPCINHSATITSNKITVIPWCHLYPVRIKIPQLSQKCLLMAGFFQSSSIRISTHCPSLLCLPLSAFPFCPLPNVINLCKTPGQLSSKMSHGLDFLKIGGIRKGLSRFRLTSEGGLQCPLLSPVLRGMGGVAAWWLHCRVPHQPFHPSVIFAGLN